jgi:hypothetical protein
MRSEEGTELQTRHEAFSCLCVALIPIDRAWSTRRVKNSENRDFCPRSRFPAKNQSLFQKFRDQNSLLREKRRLYSQAADVGCQLAHCGKGVAVALL